MKNIIFLTFIQFFVLSAFSQTNTLIKNDTSFLVSFSGKVHYWFSEPINYAFKVFDNNQESNATFETRNENPAELIIDLKRPLCLSRFDLTGSREGNSFQVFSANSLKSPWIKIFDTTSIQKHGTYETTSIVNISNKKVSRYYKIVFFQNRFEHYPGDGKLLVIGSDYDYSISEILLYESPLIKSSSTKIINNQCVTLTATASGETYLWSTGETTQSIQVCSPGTYTCQVTNTSFTGNQDHVASISITKQETQDNLPSPNGEVYTVVKNGNTVYYGGDFNSVGPITGSGAIIDNATAIPNTSLPRINGTINSTISDGLGGWYVGGSFTKVGNYNISNLAHINADNSVDTTFKPQPNGAVNTLLLNESSFYIGGAFTTIQGIANSYVAKIDKNTGSAVLWNAQCNGIVRSLALASDQLVIGGDFTSIGGQTRNYLAAVDTLYVQASTWNPNPNNKVYKVYSTATKLYVGGDFTTMSGLAKGYGAGFSIPAFTLDGYNMGANGRIHEFIVNNNVLYAAGLFTIIGGTNRSYVASLNPLNTLANSFNATVDGVVRALAISNGNLIVGGDFSNVGGQVRNRIAALNVSTGIASTWNPSMVGEKAINPIVNTLATFGNTVYAGGTFYSVGATSRNNAAAIDATTGQILPWNPNTNGIVRAIAADNNNVYLGGDFTTVNGTVTKNRIAQVNATTGVATPWNPGSDNSVNALLLKGNLLYVGGNFGNIGGAARAKVAVLSALTGSASAFNPSTNGNVNALAISGDTLYVGGDFTTIGGQTRNRLASYQISTSALLGFNPNVNGTVSAIATNGKNIYIGGTFSLIGSLLRYNLAQIDVTTGNATSQNTNVINGSSVNALVMQDSSLYAGGGYQYYNSGQTIANLASVKTQSGLISYWQPQPDDVVRAICLSENKVYVGGRFKQINSRYQPYFASLDIYNSGNPPTITSVSTTSGCIGSTLTVNGTGFVNVSDVQIGTTSVPFVVNSTTSLSITPSTALTGKVKVINVIGSPVSTETVTINDSPIASITVTGTNTVCEGNTVILNANLGDSFTYKWLRNNIEIQDAGNASYSSTSTGEYSVKVTNIKGCSAVSEPQKITFNPKPIVTVTADGPLAICQGDKLFLTANTNSQSVLYNWKKDGQYLSGTVDVTAKTKEVVSTGNYTVEVYSDGCMSESAVSKVIVNELPIVSISNTGLSSFCQGTSTTLKVNQGVGLIYSWFKNGDPLNSSTSSLLVNSTGYYNCKISDVNNCSQFSSPIEITVNNLPTAIISTNGNTSICQGGSVTLSASNASSYLWSTGATSASITVKNSGIYTVKVTDVNGCQNTSTATNVTVNPLPSVTITSIGNTTFCQGNSVLLSSSEGSSFMWSNGATSKSITATEAGTYSVETTDAFGCKSNSSPVKVSVNPLPKATIVASSNTAFCQGGSVTLSSSVGTSYLWSNGSTSSSIIASSSGNYTVQLIDVNGCKNSSSATIVTVYPLPSNNVSTSGKASLTSNGWSFCKGSEFNLSAIQGVSYLWSDGSKTQSISPSISGNYTVQVTDVNGCKNTSQVTKVIVNSLPDVTIKNTGSLSYCQGDAITLTLTSSFGNSYLWSTGATTSSIKPSNSGNYSVRVTDANGCSNLSAPVTVVVNSLPNAIITSSGKTVFCQGDEITTSLSSSNAVTYLWSNGAITSTINPKQAGKYTVQVTDVNGCKALSAAIEIKLNPLPNVIATTLKTSICIGDNVTLLGLGASSYVWDNNVSNNVAFAPSASKTYTVTGTDANGCSKTATVSVNVNNLPKVIAQASKSTICNGDNVTLSGSGATSYIWDNNVTNAVSFVPTATKVYTVTGTDANGCKNKGSITVTINVLPLVIANASKTSICFGDNVTLTGLGATSYTWDNNVLNGVSFSPSITKFYTIVGTDANGCSKSANVKVVVNSLPNVSATASKGSVCIGSQVILTGTGALKYVWDNNVSNGVSFVPTATKIYTVTGTDVNGCSKSATINIIVNDLPNVGAIASKSTVCKGDSILLTGKGAVTYVWDNNVLNGVNFTPTITKTYSVTGTDLNGCSNVSKVNVVVNNLPTVVSKALKTTICKGDSTILSGSGALKYVWDNNILDGVSFVPTSTKMYTVIGTDANGCSKSSSLNIIVNDLPVVVALASKTAVCNGSSIILTGSGASSYTWDNNVTNGVSFVPTVTKTYTVIGTNTNGCRKSASVNVMVNSLPTVTVTASSSSVCKGDSATLIGTGASKYVWDNNLLNGVAFLPLTTKIYTVIGTDSNGCSKSVKIELKVNTLPKVVISSKGNLVSCKNDGLELLTSMNGNSFLWSNGEISSNIFPSESGIYTLKLKDDNGCEGLSNAIKVTINPLPNVQIKVNGPLSYCVNNLSELVASTGVSYKWNDGSITKSIKPTISGDYSVKVTDINGCSNVSDNVTISINDCVSIDNISTKNIKVFPNPTSDKLIITFPDYQTNLEIKLFDNSGKLVKSMFSSEKEIDLYVADLSEGIYILKLKSENNFYQTKVTVTK